MSKINIRYRNVPRKGSYTDANNLGLMADKKPYLFKQVLEELFSAKHNFSGNSLSSLINSTITIKDREFEQKVKADDFKPLVIVEDIESTQVINGFVGSYGTMFRIKADHNFYLPSDVIVPLMGDKQFQLRIQNGPIATSGGYYIYEVQFINSDAVGVPEYLLKVGQEWAKMFSTASEADIQGGSTQFSGYYTLYNKTGKIRKQHEITDYAHEMVLNVDFEQNGTVKNTWLPMIEAKMLKEFEMEQERALIYARSNKGITSAVGYEIDAFPGLMEQLEDSGNNHYYNKFTVRLLEEYLSDIYFSRVNPGEVKRIVALTGWAGLIQVSKAMQQIVQENGGWRFVGNSFNPAKQSNSPYHPNSYSFGFNFSSYISDMGIQVDFVHAPTLDDRRYHKEINPLTGKPKESETMLFLNLKGEGGASNVHKVEVEGSYGFHYVRGLIGPEGRNHGHNPANSKESYMLHLTKQLGLKIDDVSSCGYLKPL